jgi:hypothetical protein
MPTKSLPAASLRTTHHLPAARIRFPGVNYLMCKALWLIRRPLFGVESCFLPALREGRSAGQALGAGPDVVEGEGHREAGVKAHQADHVGDADMVERLRFGDGAPGGFYGSRAAASTLLPTCRPPAPIPSLSAIAPPR